MATIQFYAGELIVTTVLVFDLSACLKNHNLRPKSITISEFLDDVCKETFGLIRITSYSIKYVELTEHNSIYVIDVRT